MRGLGRLTALLLAVLVVSGCAKQVGEEGPVKPLARRTVVSVAASPLPPLPHERVAGALPRVRVNETGIVIGSRTVNVSPLRADVAVSTRGGVYFLNRGELWYFSRNGARSIGYTGLHRLVVSANGRYLGLVDHDHGPAIGDGGPVAAAVVYDTSTGRIRVRSYAGMGKPSATLRSIYAITPPQPLGFEGRNFVALTPSGTWRYPVDGGKPVPGARPHQD